MPIPGWTLPIAMAVTAFVLMRADPLEVEEATAERSQQFTSRMASAFYKASGQVVVVVIDQDYIDMQESTWPMPYKHQKRLLNQVLSLDPSVVFLDVLYQNPHGDPDDKPEELLQGLRSGKSRIVMAGLTRKNLLKDSGHLRIGRCHNTQRATDLSTASFDQIFDPGSVIPIIRDHPRVDIALVDWFGCEDAYPLQLLDNPEARTPAYLLYRRHCETNACPPANTKHLSHKPIEVFWGSSPPESQTPFYEADTCQQYPGFLRRWTGFAAPLLSAGAQFLRAAISGTRDVGALRVSLPCPAVAVLPASVLESFYRGGNPDLYEPLRALFNNKAVLIGGRIEGIQDTAVSPVHGLIPGVVLHAMALDNLLAPPQPLAAVARAFAWMKVLPFSPYRLFEIGALLFVALSSARSAGKQPLEPEPRSALTRPLSMAALVGMTYFASRAISLCFAGDYAEAAFNLAAAIAIDLFRSSEACSVLKKFLGVCALSVLSTLMDFPPKTAVVLFLTCVALSLAVHGALRTESRHGALDPDSLVLAFVRRYFKSKKNRRSHEGSIIRWHARRVDVHLVVLTRRVRRVHRRLTVRHSHHSGQSDDL